MQISGGQNKPQQLGSPRTPQPRHRRRGGSGSRQEAARNKTSRTAGMTTSMVTNTATAAGTTLRRHAAVPIRPVRGLGPERVRPSVSLRASQCSGSREGRHPDRPAFHPGTRPVRHAIFGCLRGPAADGDLYPLTPRPRSGQDVRPYLLRRRAARVGCNSSLGGYSVVRTHRGLTRVDRPSSVPRCNSAPETPNQ